MMTQHLQAGGSMRMNYPSRSAVILLGAALAVLVVLWFGIGATRADDAAKSGESAREVLFEDQFDHGNVWHRDPPSGELTIKDSIGSFKDTRKPSEFTDVAPPTWTIDAKGTAPKGSYLEIKYRAPADVQVWVDLVNNKNESIATFPFTPGSGKWETVQVPFEGQFGSKGDDLFVRVRKDADATHDSVEVKYIGIYHGGLKAKDGVSGGSGSGSERGEKKN